MKLLKGFPNSIWSIQPGWTVYNFYDAHVCHTSTLAAAAAAAAKSLQSCPTLCDTIDGSPPGYAVPGILQAITLEWVPMRESEK